MDGWINCGYLISLSFFVSVNASGKQRMRKQWAAVGNLVSPRLVFQQPRKDAPDGCSGRMPHKDARGEGWSWWPWWPWWPWGPWGSQIDSPVLGDWIPPSGKIPEGIAEGILKGMLEEDSLEGKDKEMGGNAGGNGASQ